MLIEDKQALKKIVQRKINGLYPEAYPELYPEIYPDAYPDAYEFEYQDPFDDEVVKLKPQVQQMEHGEDASSVALTKEEEDVIQLRMQQGASAKKVQKQDDPAEEAQKIYDEYTSVVWGVVWGTDEENMGKALAGLVGEKPEVILLVIKKLDNEDKAQVSIYLLENLSDDKLIQMDSHLANYLYHNMVLGDINELNKDEQERSSIQEDRILKANEKAEEKASEKKQGKPEVKSEVSKVKSLAMAHLKEDIKVFEQVDIAGAWNMLKRKMLERDKQLEDAKIYVNKLSEKQKGAYTRLKKRWPTLRSYIDGTTKFDPVDQDIASKTIIDNTIKGDKDDIAILKSNSYFKITISVITESLTALNNYLSKKKTLAKRKKELDEEKVEFKRFDALFGHADLTRLINAIPHIKVTAADIKAITAQETGDFTNITVAGIKGKKTKGIISTVKNPSVYKGLGQHDVGSRDEGIAWAKKKGVTIKHSVKDDARFDPQRSILLTAAYLGRVAEELLYPGLPENKPKGNELKKMILAGYNGGPEKVKDAANAFVGKAKKNYTWNDIKNHKRISKQMRDYVSEIGQRLR